MQGVSPQSEQRCLPVQVGRYEVLGRVAVGGMSEIFLAHEKVSGEPVRRVAIKLLRSAAFDTGLRRAEAQFVREGRTLLRLDHPNICHSYEFGKLARRFFIAMEWVDGISLRELMLRLRAHDQPLPLAHAVNLVAQVAAALQHAHTACDANDQPLNVVHRDVNPSNIMVRYDGVVKLIDFGVAHVAEASHAPIDERVEGKLTYMAPEQVRGEPLDARTDIFALGICLFEIVTGTRLYRRKLPQQTCTAIMLGEVPSARAINPEVPAELDAIIQLALQKEPGARFQNACAMQAALEEFLVASNLPMGARPLSALMEPLSRERRAVPVLAPSAELLQLVSEQEAMLQEQSMVSVLEPMPRHAGPPWLSREYDEGSGPRAVPARRSDPSELTPSLRSVAGARPRARALAYVGLAALVGFGVFAVGFALAPAEKVAGAIPAASPVSARPPEGALRPSARPPEGALRPSARPPEGALRPSGTQTLAPPLGQSALALLPDTRPDAPSPSPGEPSGARAGEGSADEPVPSEPSSATHEARAASDPAERARALFREGMVHASRRELKAAARHFERAHAIQPTAINTFHWANTLSGLAHFAEAYQRLDTLRAEREIPAALSQTAAALKASLEARITRLTLTLAPDLPDARVQIDGLPASSALRATTPLTPGRHEVVVRDGGEVLFQRVIQTQAGEHVRLDVEAKALTVPPNPYLDEAP